MRTASPSPPRHRLRHVIRNNSWTTYATERNAIEQQIAAWYAPAQTAADAATLHLD